MAKLTVTIKPTGEVSTEIEGYKGPSCMDVVKSITRAMGGHVTSTTKKREYHEPPDELLVGTTCKR